MAEQQAISVAEHNRQAVRLLMEAAQLDPAKRYLYVFDDDALVVAVVEDKRQPGEPAEA